MEGVTFFDDEAREKEQNRYLLAFFLKLLWTSLTLGVLLGLLIPLTIFLRWSTFILPCMLGFLAGISIAIAVMTSLRNKALITLLLGVLTLPGLAVYLSFMAGSSPQAYEASSSALMPFIVYASVVFMGGVTLVRIWRTMPAAQQEAEKEPPQALTHGKKEHTEHEGSNLNKVA